MRLLYVAAALWCTAAAAQQSNFAPCMNASIPADQFNPIRQKILLLGGYGASFQMLTDKSSPDEAEKVAIAAYADLYGRCMESNAANRRQMPPDAAALIEANHSALTGLLARLYSGEATYGAFNTQRSEMAQRLRTALGSIEQREMSRAQAASDADMQMRRQAAMQYIMGQQPAYAPSQAAPLQLPPQPAVTNCYRFGAQTTCTTR